MKGFNILVALLVLISSCNGQETKKEAQANGDVPKDITVFGERFDAHGTISSDEMLEKYATIGAGDTLRTKFVAEVVTVCQVKGCWMKLALTDGYETMVRFRNYAFFVPKNIIGKEVIVNGSAFVEEMTVEDQKHYAKDSGVSEAEIEKISRAKRTYGFEANGVLLKE